MLAKRHRRSRQNSSSLGKHLRQTHIVLICLKPCTPKPDEIWSNHYWLDKRLNGVLSRLSTWSLWRFLSEVLLCAHPLSQALTDYATGKQRQPELSELEPAAAELLWKNVNHPSFQSNACQDLMVDECREMHPLSLESLTCTTNQPLLDLALPCRNGWLYIGQCPFDIRAMVYM